MIYYVPIWRDSAPIVFSGATRAIRMRGSSPVQTFLVRRLLPIIYLTPDDARCIDFYTNIRFLRPRVSFLTPCLGRARVSSSRNIFIISNLDEFEEKKNQWCRTVRNKNYT